MFHDSSGPSLRRCSGSYSHLSGDNGAAKSLPQAKTVRHEGHKKGVVLVPDWFTTVYLSVPNGSVLGLRKLLFDPRGDTLEVTLETGVGPAQSGSRGDD